MKTAIYNIDQNRECDYEVNRYIASNICPDDLILCTRHGEYFRHHLINDLRTACGCGKNYSRFKEDDLQKIESNILYIPKVNNVDHIWNRILGRNYRIVFFYDFTAGQMEWTQYIFNRLVGRCQRFILVSMNNHLLSQTAKLREQILELEEGGLSEKESEVYLKIIEDKDAENVRGTYKDIWSLRLTDDMVIKTFPTINQLPLWSDTYPEDYPCGT